MSINVFVFMFCCFFFFKQKTAYEMRISDWSSDVCSSDLRYAQAFRTRPVAELGRNCDKRQEARAGTNQTRALCSSMLAVGFPPLRMLYSGTQQISALIRG